MLILVAEDEPKTARFLLRGLSEHGHTVDLVADGDAALDGGLSRDYDLIILDIMLPSRDGWDILRNLRQAGCATPILCLTARDEIEDRVRGLDLGADDYLVKPFAFSELLARIRALGRRSNEFHSEGQFEIADLTVDLVKHEARRENTVLHLSPKEFALLAFLAEHTGEVLTRVMISEKVWDMNFDGDMNVIDVAIKRLRAKVDEPFSVKLIHTVRGVGYVLDRRD